MDEKAQLSQVEIRRIESETAKNEAERKKAELEAKALKKQLDQKWYSSRILVQAGVAGIVVAGLLAGWMIGYLGPLLEKNNELAKLENEIQRRANTIQRDDNEKRTKQLTVSYDNLKVELDSLLIQNQSLQSEQTKAEKLAMDLQKRLNSCCSARRRLVSAPATSGRWRTCSASARSRLRRPRKLPTR